MVPGWLHWYLDGYNGVWLGTLLPGWIQWYLPGFTGSWMDTMVPGWAHCYLDGYSLLTPKDETDRLSRNVCKTLPLAVE
jgi:hypothetical protein